MGDGSVPVRPDRRIRGFVTGMFPISDVSFIRSVEAAWLAGRPALPGIACVVTNRSRGVAVR